MDIITQKIANSPKQQSNYYPNINWVMYVADKGKNSCPKCQANHGEKFNIYDPDLPQLPIHPNCRCRYVKTVPAYASISEIEDRAMTLLQKITDDAILQTANQNKLSESIAIDVTEDVDRLRTLKKFYQKNDITEETAKVLTEHAIKAKKEKSFLREQDFFLIFNGRYLATSNGELVLDAVSGKPIESKQNINSVNPLTGFIESTNKKRFDYSYDRQGVSNEGGLPQGLYKITRKESGSLLNGNINKHLLKISGWGDYHWRLFPDEQTDTRGRKRDSFTIHGGDSLESAGCIDIGHGDKKLKQYLDSKKADYVHIYVQYDKEKVTFEEKKYRAYPIIPMR